MNSLFYRFCISCGIFFLFSPESFSLYTFPGKADTTEFVILHVNDIHAKIDNFAKLASYAKKIRKKHENVYLVSAGDIFSGNPVVDQYSDRGFPIIQLMNEAGFDVAELGNHEFDYGQEILQKRIEQAKFPILCSNVILKETPLKKFDAYKIFETKSKLKIAFLGVIQINENGIPDSHPAKLKGLGFNNWLTEILKYKNLKKENTILIGLTHLGYEDDLLLSRKMPELDVIIGAHSHTTLLNPPDTIGRTYILQAGANLTYLGVLKLKYCNGKLFYRQDSLIKFADLKDEDPEMKKEIEGYYKNPDLQEILGVADGDIKGVKNIGSFMADAITSMQGLDIAFQNNGGVRLDSILNGNITKSTVYKLDPFGNEIIAYNLTVDEIKSFIKNSYEKKNEIDLQVSGIKYIITLNKDKKIADISLTDYTGTIIKNDKKYKVGMNSYLSNTYKFDHTDKGTSLYITTAENIMNYIRKIKNIKSVYEERIIIKD